jgi:hypothetical protein
MAHGYWTAVPGRSSCGANDPCSHEAIEDISAAIQALKRFTGSSFAEVFEEIASVQFGPTIKIGR